MNMMGQDRPKPEDYDLKKLENYEMLTTLQKQNLKFEEDINKIKNEIKEAEIRPSSDVSTNKVVKKEDQSLLEEHDKANSITSAYNDLKNWVSVALNKLLTCQVRDSVNKESND